MWRILKQAFETHLVALKRQNKQMKLIFTNISSALYALHKYEAYKSLEKNLFYTPSKILIRKLIA